MGLFDSIIEATSSAAKSIFEEKITLPKKMDTLRNPMRNYMKKGEISEGELDFLISTAAKLGIGTDDFKRRFEMVLSAKKEYYEGMGKGLFSKKSPDLFFCSEDEIVEYFEGKMSLTNMTEIGEITQGIKTERKIEEEKRRPHFDSAFDDAFPVSILREAAQDVQPKQSSSTVPPPMPTTVEYTLNVNGQNQGPYNMQQLQQMAQSGQLTRQTYVWKQGMSSWEMAGNIQELVQLFGAMSPPMPPTP